MEKQLDLIGWLGRNCQCEVLNYKGVFDFYWSLKEDAANLYDGIWDDKMVWYTNREILDMYNEQVK